MGKTTAIPIKVSGKSAWRLNKILRYVESIENKHTIIVFNLKIKARLCVIFMY
jgi:hypothetical protein